MRLVLTKNENGYKILSGDFVLDPHDSFSVFLVNFRGNSNKTMQGSTCDPHLNSDMKQQPRITIRHIT